MMHHETDLTIVGGGLAGTCLALALKDTGLRMAMIEAITQEQRFQSPAGDRALALASGTVQILDGLGIWDGIKQYATPIKNIHISDRNHFGKTRLSAAAEDVEALGYVITARHIENHATNMVLKADIQQFCPARLNGLMSGADEVNLSLKVGNDSVTHSSRLIVGADGGNSSVRRLLGIEQIKTDYGQTAIVTTVKPAIYHDGTAYERFTGSGPLALLPDGGQCAVVWTRTHEEAEDLVTMSENDFTERLQDCFGYRLGELTLTAPRRSFPLTLVRTERMVSGRAVILGNAAHQLHPVAGQGFNLGLRDVVKLAEMIVRQYKEGRDIGEPGFLSEYQQSRQQDHNKVISFTDHIVRLFSNDNLLPSLARNSGLVMLDHIPAAKSYITRYAMGLSNGLPRIGKRA